MLARSIFSAAEDKLLCLRNHSGGKYITYNNGDFQNVYNKLPYNRQVVIEAYYEVCCLPKV